MAKIDIQVLISQLEEPIKRTARPIATKLASQKFEQSKKDFLEAFLNHPISKELEDGSTRTSSDIIEKGSLFGFIGFDEGSNPIEELYDYLKENIKFDKAGIYNRSKKTYEFSVIIPSKEDIKNVTPMPWGTAKSWAFAIESGISGLNNYLFKEKYGRSGAGIQIKDSPTKSKNGSTYRPQPYMSSLLNFLTKSLGS